MLEPGGEDPRALDADVALRAIKALQSHLKQRSATGKPQLVDDDRFYLLCINVFAAPDKSNPKPIRIDIPHSLYLDGADLCLITKDPQRDVKEHLRTHPVDGYRKVIGVAKLRKKFAQYKDRRDLARAFDLFVADDRVLPLLPAVLGKAFFSRKKQPVPVRIADAKSATKALERARDSTYLFKSAGSCMTVKIGRVGQDGAAVVQNIVAGMQGVVRQVKGGWDNIQSVHLKTTESAALELFSQLPRLESA